MDAAGAFLSNDIRYPHQAPSNAFTRPGPNGVLHPSRRLALGSRPALRWDCIYMAFRHRTCSQVCHALSAWFSQTHPNAETNGTGFIHTYKLSGVRNGEDLSASRNSCSAR
jgi:hypothetical protein